LQHIFKEWDCASFAVRLLGRLDAAELQNGVATGLLGSHSGAEIVVDVQLKMTLDLVGKRPLAPGKRVKVYLGGEGVDQVPGTSIAVNSPFFTVDPATLAREQIAAPFPIVSTCCTSHRHFHRRFRKTRTS